MAKKTGSALAINFAPDYSCAVWVQIPVSLIEKVDHLGKITCKDHEHEHVRLYFVNPTTDESKALTELLKQLIGLNERWLPQSDLTHAPPAEVYPALAGQPNAMSFGWHPSHIAAYRWPPIDIPWPPIHIPDPRDALRRRAEQLAKATAARIDQEKGSSTYCPKEEIRRGLIALGLLFTATPDPTGSSGIMASVLGALALTFPEEYCRNSGR